MDFFAQQDKTRRKTKLLVFYFILAVVAIIACLLLRRCWSFLMPPSRNIIIMDYDEQPQLVLWDPRLFLGVTVGVLAVIVIGSAYKTNELAGGGGSVATLMGGRP